MAQPNIPDKKPIVLELDPGTYFWCSCGNSQKQPFCDGAHKGTEFQPVKMDVTEKKRVALCNCKVTKNPPLCDGAHKTI